VYEPADRTIFIPWSFVEESRGALHDLPLLHDLRSRQLDEVETSANVFVL
jgi:hypothetical protein